jgi:eukaryotic-like serine/threonine-protein kinase
MDMPLMSALLDHSTWHKISEHLDTLLDLEQAERGRWLNQLTDTDPATAALLKELIAKANVANSLLDSPLLAELGLPSSDASMVGKQIGGYTIERLIGRGGMGAVWLASRSDGRFEGYRAIKFIDSTGARADLIERFAKEGRLLARLSHPNIAQLIDAGVTDEGKQFLVLEYVDGERIDNYCESRNLTVEARVRLFLGAVSAVAHAHSQLVIHRDLKPSNVLVARDETVKLLDFGIAKLLSAEPSLDDGTHTRAEESALTPDYAAPEQLLGDVPSTATDVYQLGVLLYVLLTGTHPLQLSGTRAERVKALFNSRIPLASEVCSGTPRKTLRGDLDAILAKALDNEPSKRYPTAAALHDELIRYLDREPVQARRGAGLYQARKFVARHRLIVGVSAIAVAALCAAAVFSVGQARAARTERDRAVSLASRNDAVNDFLNTLITQVADSGKPVTIDEMLARSERLALLDTRANPVNRAAVLAMIAARYQALSDRAKAAALLERALALLAPTPGEGLRSELRCGYALVISEMGRRGEALRLISDELAHPSADPASLAECLLDRAQLAAAVNDADGTLSYGLQALGQLRSSTGSTTTEAPEFLSVVANGYRMKGDQREAMRYYELALQKFSELGRADSPSALVTRNDLAVGIEAAGVPGRALQLYDDALSVLARRNPIGDPPLFLLANRGRALLTLGRYEQSRVSYERALDVAARVGNKTGEAHCFIGLARIATQLMELAMAEKYLVQAQSRVAPDQMASLSTFPLASGNLALARGEIEEARRQFSQAAAVKGSQATVTDALIGDAEALLKAGDATAAAAQAHAAIKSASSLQGGLPYSQRTGRASLILGRALQKLGDTSQAHRAFTAAANNLENTVDPAHPLLREARSLARSY